MTKYEISMEVSGPIAMWSRPDTGSSPTSYPLPTWSAAKGLFEAIAFYRDGRAWINPTRVELCTPLNAVNKGSVHFQKYITNYGGPLREGSLIKKRASYQHPAIVVVDPCYRIYANVENGSNQPLRFGNNPCHALQAMFQRRLKKGQCYYTPCLGWSEFVPSYWGPFRDSTNVDVEINLNLVSVLKKVFNKPLDGLFSPQFQRADEALVKAGVFHYAK